MGAMLRWTAVAASAGWVLSLVMAVSASGDLVIGGPCTPGGTGAGGCPNTCKVGCPGPHFNDLCEDTEQTYCYYNIKASCGAKVDPNNNCVTTSGVCTQKYTRCYQ